MYKIGVIGDRDSIYGFSSVGLSVFPADSGAEAAKLIKQMSETYAVIFITETLAEEIQSEISKYSSRTVPAIIPIPGLTGNTGLGMRLVSKSVEKAVGSDVLS